MSDKAVRHFYWDDEFPEGAEDWQFDDWHEWHQEHAPWLHDEKGVAILSGEINCTREHAALIEKTLNSHYKLVEALEACLRLIEKNTCLHEETERRGIIWEKCLACGRMWADDEGGKPEFEWPAEVEQARQALAEVKS